MFLSPALWICSFLFFQIFTRLAPLVYLGFYLMKGKPFWITVLVWFLTRQTLRPVLEAESLFCKVISDGSEEIAKKDKTREKANEGCVDRWATTQSYWKLLERLRRTHFRIVNNFIPHWIKIVSGDTNTSPSPMYLLSQQVLEGVAHNRLTVNICWMSKWDM